MRPLLVIFDCDGVLVDSEELASATLAQAMSLLGIEASAEEIDRRFRGRSLADCVLAIEKQLGKNVPRDFIAHLNTETFNAFKERLTPVAHVRAALTLIQAEGIELCVASSGSLEKMTFTLGLTELLPFFDQRLFSASEVKHGKPAPDLFLHAANKMSIAIEQSVVVEDSLPGAAGAVAAGARVLGYVAPEHPQEEQHKNQMRDLGAEVFSSMRDLSTLLDLSRTIGKGDMSASQSNVPPLT